MPEVMPRHARCPMSISFLSYSTRVSDRSQLWSQVTYNKQSMIIQNLTSTYTQSMFYIRIKAIPSMEAATFAPSFLPHPAPLIVSSVFSLCGPCKIMPNASQITTIGIFCIMNIAFAFSPIYGSWRAVPRTFSWVDEVELGRLRHQCTAYYFYYGEKRKFSVGVPHPRRTTMSLADVIVFGTTF